MSAPQLPAVAVNMAMTLDGKVMRPDGGWHGLTSNADRERMDRYRREADLLIVGKNSISKDDPPVVPAGSGRAPVACMIARNSLPPADRKIFTAPAPRRPLLLLGNRQPAVLRAIGNQNTRSGRALDPAALTPPDPTDTSSHAAPDAAEQFALLKSLAERARVILFPPELLEPAPVLDYLYREHAVRRVLLEGGPQVNHAFFAADLVDVLHLTLVPYLIGQRDLPGIVDGAEPFGRLDHPDSGWQLDRCEPHGREVFLT